MVDLLNPTIRPGDMPRGRRGKHIGKIPVILFGIVALAIVVALIYGGLSRIARQNAEQALGPGETGETLGGKELEGWLKEQPDGYIDPDTNTPQIITIDNTQTIIEKNEPLATPVSPAPTREYTELEKLYMELQKAAVEEYLAALQSDSSVDDFRQADQSGDSGAPLSQTDALRQQVLGQLAGLANAQTGGVGDQAFASGQVLDDPNKQFSKIAFTEQQRAAGGYLQSTRQDQITPYEIKVGTVIPGVMISGVNSDLPGQLIAQVSEHVYDSATGQYLLIPQGTRLYGLYDSQVSYGQRRALVVWTQAVFPDGSSLDIEAMQGSDQSGYAGFKDKVNNHYLRTFGSIFLLSIFNALPAMLEDGGSSDSSASSEQTITTVPVTTEEVVGVDANGEPIIVSTTSEEVVVTSSSQSNESSTEGGNSASAEFREQLAATTSEAGLELTRRNLNIQPTLEIRPGYKFNIMVNKDIAFTAPYRSFR